MAVSVDIQIKGGAALDKALAEFEPRIAKKILRQALRAAAKPVQAAAKAKAPVSVDGSHGNPPGTLRDSIKVRAMRRKKGQLGVIVRTGEGDYKGKTFYGSFIEWGTKHQSAMPYMRPAFDETKGEAVNIFISKVSAGVTQVASELRAKGA